MLPHIPQTPICEGRVGAKVLSHTLRIPSLSAYTMQLTGFFKNLEFRRVEHTWGLNPASEMLQFAKTGLVRIQSTKRMADKKKAVVVGEPKNLDEVRFGLVQDGVFDPDYAINGVSVQCLVPVCAWDALALVTRVSVFAGCVCKMAGALWRVFKEERGQDQVL